MHIMKLRLLLLSLAVVLPLYSCAPGCNCEDPAAYSLAGTTWEEYSHNQGAGYLSRIEFVDGTTGVWTLREAGAENTLTENFTYHYSHPSLNIDKQEGSTFSGSVFGDVIIISSYYKFKKQ